MKHLWRHLLLLLTGCLPAFAETQQGGRMGEMMSGMMRERMSCSMIGGGGLAFVILACIFLLAASIALVALAIFLIRKSRVPK